jgi:MFS superfamily sulfate permease-like transporter
MNNTKMKSIPSDGWLGFKQNIKSDAASGFVVFLLALPLSLGIAKASDFPPIMGLITAIIGGILVSFFMGSRLTIKGPAAGLIVIVAGSVAEFGQGDAILGWKLALGALVFAGLIQILFGLLKFGRFIDFFPLSAIHGMLAAIGIIIIAKQIPILLNDDFNIYKGLTPIELLLHIPEFIRALDPKATIIGVFSLIIMMGWPYIKFKKLNRIPAPLIVLLFAIPFEYFVIFNGDNVSESLVVIGSLLNHINIYVDFGGIYQKLPAALA